MSTPREKKGDAVQEKTPDGRPITKPSPSGQAKEHTGAREDEVGKTMPPSPDDDEPKQG
jgi:hypothetical protein